MQITRAKATALLNKGEMQLYDDSRQNALRGFTASQLDTRITRARSARDRSRDLVRRQKLASRARTGSKRGASGTANQRSKDKAAIMADILKRFEAGLKDAKKREKEEAAAERKKAAVAKKTAKKATKKIAKKAAKKTVAKKAAKKVAKKAVRKAASKATKKVAKKTVGKTAKKTAKKVARNAARKAAKKTPAAKKKVTPKQALRSTRKVLEAKQEQARQPRPWQDATAHGGQVGSEGFQSAAAAHRAEELQAAASRMPAIHGSAGTRGRINQGKRDGKGGD
ncbi:hypothetical protein ACOPJQ_12750 [Luteimonas dalianensis]|uniref:hypothetical protein n=1 Tax=Luteimonas dalianensis TaxID=1148196 RepID=UPI003BF089D5